MADQTRPAQYASIAGRWRQHVAATGVDKALPRKEQAVAMLMFYAGFSAALDATAELAEFDESEAIQLLQALHIEVKQVEAMATRLLKGGPLS